VKTLIGLILAAAAWSASICGQRSTVSGVDTSVACIDFDQLSKIAPSVPWPSGTVTQVLLISPTPIVARVQVDAEVQLIELVPNQQGQWVGIAQFSGMAHENLNVRIYREAP
jgi:hypothetical protein